MPWYQKYIDDKDWHQWYQQEAHRRLGNSVPDLENSCAEAVSRLILDKLPKAELKHGGNHDGYVANCFRNILTDINRELNGRIRPPLAMRKIGVPITSIFMLHCFDKLRVTDIAERLSLTLDVVEHWVSWLKKERKCPENTRTVPIMYEDGKQERSIEQFNMDDPDPITNNYAETEQQEIMAQLFGLSQPNRELQSSLSEEQSANSNDFSPHQAVEDKLSKLRSRIQLTNEDRLLLKLRAIEGRSRRYVGEALGISPATVQNRETRLFESLREVLVSEGFIP